MLRGGLIDRAYQDEKNYNTSKVSRVVKQKRIVNQRKADMLVIKPVNIRFSLFICLFFKIRKEKIKIQIVDNSV